ncbi:unnamed protein product [Hymenolepis diminuta]|uniref:Uncharacterized protein n=1 Tax=Hymenolepis diminuta TaxID=6216 RepID=A0A564XZJ4_HYMDI|nr:unnamed protein product [Hymenolepis diminuta]
MSVMDSYAYLLSPLLLSIPSLSLLLVSILAVASLNTFWSNQLLTFCTTSVVNSYSNSYGLVTVVAIICFQLPDVSC